MAANCPAVQAGVEFAKSLGAKVTGLSAVAQYPIMGYGEVSAMWLITPEVCLPLSHCWNRCT